MEKFHSCKTYQQKIIWKDTSSKGQHKLANSMIIYTTTFYDRFQPHWGSHQRLIPPQLLQCLVSLWRGPSPWLLSRQHRQGRQCCIPSRWKLLGSLLWSGLQHAVSPEKKLVAMKKNVKLKRKNGSATSGFVSRLLGLASKKLIEYLLHN